MPAKKKTDCQQDVLPAMKAVREPKGWLSDGSACISCSVDETVTPGKVSRSVQGLLDLTGMVEVALFADIPDLKEALEFDSHVKEKGITQPDPVAAARCGSP
ncbi:MAG: hypothetical protein ACLTLQ_08115 [[Clostridium] scindens]